jgi:hypothetical protein
MRSLERSRTLLERSTGLAERSAMPEKRSAPTFESSTERGMDTMTKKEHKPAKISLTTHPAQPIMSSILSGMVEPGGP